MDFENLEDCEKIVTHIIWYVVRLFCTQFCKIIQEDFFSVIDLILNSVLMYYNANETLVIHYSIE